MYIAKTLSGLEDILAGELKTIGAKNIQILKRAVGFDGDDETMYKANYCCRTAIKILKPIANFPAHSEEELYNNVKDINWSDYLDIDMTLAIDGTLSSSNLTHSHYIALKAKDAIADHFFDKHKKRPSVDTENPSVRLNVHIWNNQCNLSLDSSGESLHKRGYRQSTGIAPINEALAAGLIFLSKWDKKTPLLDPFCGSGTIPMEAAMIAMNIPSGYYRKKFGFETWKDFNAELWNKVKEEADAEINEEEPSVFGSDILAKAVQNSKQNLQYAKLHKDVVILHSSFERLKPPFGKGIIICNPPYGERMEKEDIIGFYKMIGDTLKQNYAGYEAWIIASDLYALKFVGLRPSAKIDVFNGKLPCKFVKFELYEGSRKGSKNKG